MRYQGVVARVISDYLVLVDTGKRTSQRFWRIDTSREMTRLGNHKCELQNAPVTFDFDGRRVTDFQIDAPDFDLDQKEESTIIYTRHEHTPHGGFGFMKRDGCACSIVFHHSDVLTWGNIQVGAQCRHRVDVVRAERAVATEIELYRVSE